MRLVCRRGTNIASFLTKSSRVLAQAWRTMTVRDDAWGDEG